MMRMSVHGEVGSAAVERSYTSGACAATLRRIFSVWPLHASVDMPLLGHQDMLLEARPTDLCIEGSTRTNSGGEDELTCPKPPGTT